MEGNEEIQIEKLKQEITLLNSKLKQSYDEKEAKYVEKEELDKKLALAIKQAKELKVKKEDIDTKVKELKKTREVFNKEIKPMFAQLSELKKKFGLDVVKKEKKGKTQRPDEIKRQIDALQYSIATEALSFEREKSYMERIKRLKAQLGEHAEEEEKYRELKELKSKINTQKDKADEVHAEVQKLAGESTQIFKSLTAQSEIIAKFRKDKGAVQEILKSIKAQMETLSNQLAETLANWSKLAPKLEPPAAITFETPKTSGLLRREVDISSLKEKKKLRKEDILALQRDAIRRR